MYQDLLPMVFVDTFQTMVSMFGQCVINWKNEPSNLFLNGYFQD